jgi:hypothetical protein
MITGKEDLLMALSEAFLMEKGTKAFYSEAAEKSVNLAWVYSDGKDLQGRT